jgi:hypothetical protein
VKATSDHNSPTKTEADNKVSNPTFTCESNIPTQLMPSLIKETNNKLNEFHNKRYGNFISEQYKPEIPNFHTIKWKSVAS